jgi:hypothetical protein
VLYGEGIGRVVFLPSEKKNEENLHEADRKGCFGCFTLSRGSEAGGFAIRLRVTEETEHSRHLGNRKTICNRHVPRRASRGMDGVAIHLKERPAGILVSLTDGCPNRPPTRRCLPEPPSVQWLGCISAMEDGLTKETQGDAAGEKTESAAAGATTKKIECELRLLCLLRECGNRRSQKK